jgi:hypothetical protein
MRKPHGASTGDAAGEPAAVAMPALAVHRLVRPERLTIP